MLVPGRERPVLILEAAAAVLLTLASVLVILAVIAADGWGEADRRGEPAESAPPWRCAA
jgi:hypothetical protein